MKVSGKQIASARELLGITQGELALITEGRAVIPGHGARLRSQEALAIAGDDIAYLEGLLAAQTAQSRDRAHALQLPRAAEVVGMREHHLDNCAVIGLA